MSTRGVGGRLELWESSPEREITTHSKVVSSESTRSLLRPVGEKTEVEVGRGRGPSTGDKGDPHYQVAIVLEDQK